MANPSNQLITKTFGCITYLPNPSLTIYGIGIGYGFVATPFGATSWTVYDCDTEGEPQVIVATGSCSTGDSQFTVMTSGTWASGGSVEPGYYQGVTNNGFGFAFCVCAEDSVIYNPSAVDCTYDSIRFAAWLGCANDRDYYSGPGGGGTWTGSVTPAEVVYNADHDPYFQFAQDTAAGRGHRLWLASSAQQGPPTWAPSSSDWAAMATYLAAHGWAGADYEIPTNEPENAGADAAQILAQCNTVGEAILAADPTAKIWIYDSPGGAGTFATFETILAGLTFTPYGLTTHMEESHQNLSIIAYLRTYAAKLKAAWNNAGFSGNPPVRFTETGINGGVYSVLASVREARQRTMFNMVMEQELGSPACWNYPFPISDRIFSGYSTYVEEGVYNGGPSPDPTTFVGEGGGASNGVFMGAGAVRAGGYAMHVQAVQLYGMPCTPADPPTKLSFGATGSAADNAFIASLYQGADGVVVELGTDGVFGCSMVLSVSGYSSGASITYVNGWGRDATATVSAEGTITVPVGVLCTYVQLASDTAVSVADVLDAENNSVLAELANTNVIPLASSLVNQASSAVTVINSGNYDAGYNEGVNSPNPYSDATVPGTVTASNFNGSGAALNVGAFALASCASWQANNVALVAFTLSATVGGTPQTIYSFTNLTAVSYAIPSATGFFGSDYCTRSTFWNQAYTFVSAVSPTGAATALELAISATGFGGQPDAAASEVEENDPQVIVLRQWQVFEGGGGGGGPFLPAAQEDAAIEAIFVPGVTYHMGLNLTDPGTTGAGEVTGGTYGRQVIIFGEPTDGVEVSTNGQTFTGMPAVASGGIPYASFWSAASGGTYLGGGVLADVPLNPDEPIPAGATVVIAAGATSVGVSG